MTHFSKIPSLVYFLGLSYKIVSPSNSEENIEFLLYEQE